MKVTEIAGRYELLSTLGGGASGVVHESFDRRLERRVAIKLINMPAAEDVEAIEGRERFRREARAAGRLSHRNIVSVYDYGEQDDLAWIVMELVDGQSLKAALDSGVPLPLPDVVRMIGETLAALGYSHACGIVHRDIKPANILLAKDGTAKISDFGVARIENSTMTQIGTLIGTPNYMAPEQLRGEPADFKADIWATGVVLYEALTGERCFSGGFASVMHKALNTVPAPPSRVDQVPAVFDSVVARAMAQDPSERFESAAEFQLALEHAAREAMPEEADATLVRSNPDRMLRRDAPADIRTERTLRAAQETRLQSVRAPAEKMARFPRPALARWALGGLALAVVLGAGLVMAWPWKSGDVQKLAEVREVQTPPQKLPEAPSDAPLAAMQPVAPAPQPPPTVADTAADPLPAAPPVALPSTPPPVVQDAPRAMEELHVASPESSLTRPPQSSASDGARTPAAASLLPDRPATPPADRLRPREATRPPPARPAPSSVATPPQRPPADRPPARAPRAGQAEEPALPLRSPPPGVLGAMLGQAADTPPPAQVAQASIVPIAPPAPKTRPRVVIHHRAGATGESMATAVAQRLLFSNFQYASSDTADKVPDAPTIRYHAADDAEVANRLADLLRGTGTDFQVQQAADPAARQGTLDVWINR